MSLTNSQYDEIMREYNQLKFRHVREREERIQEIYQKIPAVFELENEITTLAASQARKLLGGDKNSLKELKIRMADLKEQKKVLLLANGYDANAMELQYSCKKCGDTGYINGKKCKCFRQKEINMLYRQSNLRQILEKENFDTFSFEWYDSTASDRRLSPLENMRNIAAVCKEMTAEFAHEKTNLLLTGPAGTGKTFLTHCIAKALLDACYSVIYLSAAELFEIFSSHQFQDKPEPEEELMYHHIYECDLLIIDDLGTEVANNFTISRLFSCINERARNDRPVVISTNLTLAQINSHYSERISSRLISNYKILELYGDDIRIRKLIAHRRENNG
ncbi:MAG: ATP-binding protein [Lachnospiraceae bacterium]|nr:ATP-binding protein [Lachnospiraceae bacterium]